MMLQPIFHCETGGCGMSCPHPIASPREHLIGYVVLSRYRYKISLSSSMINTQVPSYAAKS